jgi:hypothetical protein
MYVLIINFNSKGTSSYEFGNASADIVWASYCNTVKCTVCCNLDDIRDISLYHEGCRVAYEEF